MLRARPLLVVLAFVAGPAFAAQDPVSPPPSPSSAQSPSSASLGTRNGDQVQPRSAASIDSLIGQRIAGVRLERLGQVVTDAPLVSLVETRAGAPLSMREVRDTVLHLFNTGLFQDVSVAAEPNGAATTGSAGVTLVYTLTPARTVTRYDFRGEAGLSESDLRRRLVDRYGTHPSIARVQGAVGVIESAYKEAGYLNARVTSTTEQITPETVALVMNVTSGPRARVGHIDLRGQADLHQIGHATPAAVQARLGVAEGQPFNGPEMQKRIDKLVQQLRNAGYYEATIAPTQTPREDGQVVDLAIAIDPGPRVSVRVEGSAIPASRQEDLVPVRREGSIDEDLLEDSKRRIENYLHGRGHWKAEVAYTRRTTPTGLDLVFSVKEGAVYRIAEVQVSGNKAMARLEIDSVLGLANGALYVESDVDAKTNALVERYRRQGFRQIKIVQDVAPREEPPRDSGAHGALAGKVAAGTAWVEIRLAIAEGPQTRVGAIAVRGNTAIDDASLRAVLGLKVGEPFYEPQIAADREAIQNLYLNRGFDRVQVDVTPTTAADGAGTDLAFTVREGAQLFVDRILIVGNRRTESRTIEKALTIKPGDPLGLSALLESQRRLSGLGLFRRVRITDVGEPGESRRDVIVTVDEAPPTTVGYGAGIEAGRRVGSGPNDSATEKVDVAGRGFFEVSRRNVFGSNRSVTLFTRGSVRPRDRPDSDESSFGFNEYRVLTTLRDPDAFNTTIDMQVSGYFEQAVRSSFNFRRRGLQSDFAKRLRNRFTVVGSYSFTQTELFDERITEEERPDIDRLFPEVRLSIFSGATRRDTRDDVLDPTRGTVLGLNSDVAVRALGSEVGFVKGFGEYFWYRQIPRFRGAIFATGARVGLAKGFRREVPRVIEGIPVVDPNGEPLVDTITDLPASERFFAGGDTTVRGYARDTLGDQSTIIKGFPSGGNAMIIFNGELRVPVWRDFGSALFLDVGNVFSRVSEVDFQRLRPTAGFGVRYKSPIGPIRVDLGFKLDRGRFERSPFDPFYKRESLAEFHISIGQAF